VDPVEYRNEWEKIGPIDLLERIPEYPKNVCLTGGEPMLQKESELQEVVRKLVGRNQSIEMFTNGTILYPEWLLRDVFVVMDWKLPGSGERDNQWGMNNEIRVQNFHRLQPTDAVKFTIADAADFEAALDIYNKYFHGQAGWVPPMVFAGFVWGKDMTNERLVELILEEKLPWRHNLQVHNFIWDRSQRGI